jgi:hypothetical protein
VEDRGIVPELLAVRLLEGHRRAVSASSMIPTPCSIC